MLFHMYNSMIFRPRNPLERIWSLPGSTKGKSLWETLSLLGDLIWKDTRRGRKQWLGAGLGSPLSFPQGKTQTCLRKKITYFSFENPQSFKCTKDENGQFTFLSDSSTLVSALKLYLAIASPISPGWAGGGGLAGCAFSGGVSFYEGKQWFILDLW